MTPSDERRWWTGLADLLERRVRLILDASVRTDGPVYDPTKGGAGDGRVCSKCRKVSRSDARLCGSCGTILRMTP